MAPSLWQHDGRGGDCVGELPSQDLSVHRVPSILGGDVRVTERK